MRLTLTSWPYGGGHARAPVLVLSSPQPQGTRAEAARKDCGISSNILLPPPNYAFRVPQTTAITLRPQGLGPPGSPFLSASEESAVSCTLGPSYVKKAARPSPPQLPCLCHCAHCEWSETQNARLQTGDKLRPLTSLTVGLTGHPSCQRTQEAN